MASIGEIWDLIKDTDYIWFIPFEMFFYKVNTPKAWEMNMEA